MSVHDIFWFFLNPRLFQGFSVSFQSLSSRSCILITCDNCDFFMPLFNQAVHRIFRSLAVIRIDAVKIFSADITVEQYNRDLILFQFFQQLYRFFIIICDRNQHNPFYHFLPDSFQHPVFYLQIIIGSVHEHIIIILTCRIRKSMQDLAEE